MNEPKSLDDIEGAEDIEDDEDDVMEEFIKFFDNLFTNPCEEMNALKAICRGIALKKHKTKKKFADIIK